MKNPWTYREGIVIGAGLAVVGILLQLSVGAIDWALFAFPFNIIALAVVLALVVALVFFGNRSNAIRYLTSGKAAVVSLVYVSIVTVVMGFGNDLLSSWVFVLPYLWMTLIVGAVSVRQLLALRSWRGGRKGRWGALFSHVGLFMALVCGTLGNADIQKLRVAIPEGGREQLAYDMQNRPHKLDFAIRLNDFSIEMYPAELGGGPKRYASDVTLFIADGDSLRDTILVNKPLSIMGWKVYQLSYNEAMGGMSESSVLELVRDPWLPYVYAGIFMLLLGAILLFFKH